MNTQTSVHSILDLSCYIAGRAVQTGNWLTVVNPYTGDPAGRVACLNQNHVEQAITAALQSGPSLSRYARSEILMKARTLLEERAESFAHLITAESGLCMRESRYEVGRSCDVLQFAAMEALKDDGQVFSCDISPQGKTRQNLHAP